MFRLLNHLLTMSENRVNKTFFLHSKLHNSGASKTLAPLLRKRGYSIHMATIYHDAQTQADKSYLLDLRQNG